MPRIFPVLLTLFAFFSAPMAQAEGYTATAMTFEPMEFNISDGKWAPMDKIQKSGATVELNLNHGSIYGLKVIIEGKEGKSRWGARLHATIECNTCFYQGKHAKHKVEILPAATMPRLFAAKKGQKAKAFGFLQLPIWSNNAGDNRIVVELRDGKHSLIKGKINLYAEGFE